LELFVPEKKEEINYCLSNLSSGFSKLDPDLPKYRLVTKWRLWLSEGISLDTETRDTDLFQKIAY